MKKILVILPILFLCFSLPVLGATETRPYKGTTTESPETGLYHVPDSSDSSVVWTSVTISGSSGEVIFYQWISDTTWVEVGRSATPSTVTAPPNSNGFRIKSLDGGEVFIVQGTANNGNTYVYDSKPTGSDNDYSQVLNDILNSTNSNGEKLGSILDELKTTVSVSKPSVPVAPTIDDSDRISKNKPAENPVFKDDGTYFSDTGNDTGNSQYMTPLPSAPDVEDWDGVSKQPDGTAESTLTQDGELIKDSDLVTDSFTQDGELTKDGEMATDSFTQDSPFTKDGEMTTDSFTQDGVLTKDSFTSDSILEVTPMSPTENYGSTNSMTQDNFYNQTEFYNVTH